MRPAIEGLQSPRCVDSEGLLAQTEVPRRLVILGGGVIGCEFASIFARFGSQVTIIEMLPALIAQEDADASRELAKQFRMRGITLHLGKQCAKVDDSGSELTLIKGNLSFAQESDLTLQTLLREHSDNPLPEQGYVLKISGPLDGPKISVEKIGVRQPAD